jgi:uncharacterized coiled-coil protein SlyX
MNIHMLENRVVDLESQVKALDKCLTELENVVEEMRSSFKMHIEWHPGKGK